MNAPLSSKQTVKTERTRSREGKIFKMGEARGRQHSADKIVALEAEIELLRRDIDMSLDGKKLWEDFVSMYRAAGSLLLSYIDERDALADDIERLQRECSAKQARIDALMMEHCPDELTGKQVEELGKHQRVADEPSAAPEHVALVDELFNASRLWSKAMQQTLTIKQTEAQARLDAARAAVLNALRASEPPTDRYGRREPPHGYAYRYHDYRGDVLRFNNGEEVNGGMPFEVVPYWIGAPVTKPAVKERDCPNCDTAMPDGCKGTFKDEGPACWHNWWHLKPFGYAPGKYTLKCPHCKTHVFNVDKRASACMPCATALYESKQREAGETSATNSSTNAPSGANRDVSTGIEP